MSPVREFQESLLRELDQAAVPATAHRHPTAVAPAFCQVPGEQLQPAQPCSCSSAQSPPVLREWFPGRESRRAREVSALELAEPRRASSISASVLREALDDSRSMSRGAAWS